MPERAVQFQLTGRYAHFLVAEGGASAPSYPFPPRTALLGLVGAVLGMGKDTPQTELEAAEFAVSGTFADRHWHMANLRKYPPAALPWTVKKASKGSDSKSKNTRLSQEYLINPSYTVTASLPEPWHADLNQRIDERAWHFTPCLGQSELLADLKWLAEGPIKQLPSGSYEVASAFPRDHATVDLSKAYDAGHNLLAVYMPHLVTPDRSFTLRSYFFERGNKPVSVQTDKAVNFEGSTLVWL